MLLQILILLAGLALVVFGADYLVEGASGIARRFGLSEFVIGLTIVGMGTSAPEMVVSFIGAFHGNADISVGNVVGSNIFNTLLILGITGMLLPMAITPENRRRDRMIDHGRLLAEAVAEELSLPCRPLLVRRKTHDRNQARLGREARQKNLRNAFVPAAEMDFPVLLVDDVLTTGTTARRCAEALRAGGAPSVTVLAMTRAMGGRPA